MDVTCASISSVAGDALGNREQRSGDFQELLRKSRRWRYMI